MSEVKHTLPTIAELHETNPDIAYKQDRLNLLLSAPPRKEWIKKHPIINVKKAGGQSGPLEYLPETIVRFLLRKIFGRFKEEILREGVMFNSAYVVVRVHYFNPITEDWEFTDGAGAVGVQTDKGEAAGNMSAIKSDAVMKALPSAASYAFKNACKKLGAIFGGDLNKITTEAFVPGHAAPVEQPPVTAAAVRPTEQPKNTVPAFSVPGVDGPPDFNNFGSTGTTPAAESGKIQF